MVSHIYKFTGECNGQTTPIYHWYCIPIFCFSVYDVIWYYLYSVMFPVYDINFETNLNFLLNHFLTWPESQSKNLKTSKTKKNTSKGEMKSICNYILILFLSIWRVINYENNVIFLLSHFYTWPDSQNENLNISRTKNNF